MALLARLKDAWRRLGGVEKIFVLALLGELAIEFLLPGNLAAPLLRIVVYAFGAWAALRLARRLIKKAIWRLRNRLVVAYVFIAVVPVALILVLAGLGIWMASTQVAVYLVTSELDRRATSLKESAQWIAGLPEASRDASIRRIRADHVRRFPGLEILVAGTAEGRDEAGGAVMKEGRLYAWARVVRGQVEVTLMAPLTVDVLSEMIPSLGEVNYRDLIETAPGERRTASVPRLVAGKKEMAPAEPRREPRKDYLPPPVNRLDREVLWFSILPVSLWESPKPGQAVMLSVRSRPSAVFDAVSARKADWEQSLLPSAFVLVAALFLIVEMVSLIAGISLSRTITAAVHGLYEATLRVREADFSHRIQVQGNDQLADLSYSFNSMTENLERLLAVAMLCSFL